MRKKFGLEGLMMDE